jgi:hypothetical protein
MGEGGKKEKCNMVKIHVDDDFFNTRGVQYKKGRIGCIFREKKQQGNYLFGNRCCIGLET